MTHNFSEKGHPTGPWATASRSPQGQFGVAVGVGAAQIGFVAEDGLNAWIAAALKVGEAPDLTALVIDAAKALPAFKANVAQRLKRSANAANN